MRKLESFIYVLVAIGALSLVPAFGQDKEPISLEINKRPLTDFSQFAGSEIRTGFDLSSEFLVELKGQIGQDGKIDGNTAKFIRTEGDPRTITFVKRLVEALNEAGYFSYFGRAIGRQFTLAIQQNKDSVLTEMRAELDNESQARARKSSFDFLVRMSEMRKNAEELTQAEKDDIFILKSISTTLNGKSLSLASTLPKAFVGEKIKELVAN